jgi:hypothetical protein
MCINHDEKPPSPDDLHHEVQALRELLLRSSGLMIQSTDIKLREAGTMIRQTIKKQQRRRVNK